MKKFLNNNFDTILYSLVLAVALFFLLRPIGILAGLILGGFMERFGNNIKNQFNSKDIFK